MIEEALLIVADTTCPELNEEDLSEPCECEYQLGIGDIRPNYINPRPVEYISSASDSEVFEAQSGQDADMPELDLDSKHQVVTFSDAVHDYAYNVDSRYDKTRYNADDGDVYLGDFFKRPVLIYDREWTQNVAFDDDINPWELFFKNKRVMNRINNYKMMRSKLHLKFVINGNAFYYGRMLAAYWPLKAFDGASRHDPAITADLTHTSQLPHIYLDPCTSMGGEMILPYFWHEDYLNLLNEDYGDMGNILLRSLNVLKHANGDDTNVRITIYAWAEEMQLVAPISENLLGLPNQSGEEIDEANAKGVISGPATTVAAMSAKLGQVPYIGPYAMATSKIAGLTASMAKIFGYSRPPVTENPSPMRPTPASSLSHTTTADTAVKLSVDDKQELSLDPRTAGLGGADDLAITSVASREAYLTTFNWTVADNPGTLKFSSLVDPSLYAYNASLVPEYVLTPMAIAKMPFKYWRGTIRFRVQIVCSNFHKGRLKIHFDPGTLKNAAIEEYNVGFSEVIDIAQCTDQTFEIGWAQPTAMVTSPNVDAAPSVAHYRTDGTELPISDGVGNGTFAISVVNSLTTPNTGGDAISINIFVSAGKDFQVFAPDNRFQGYLLSDQSGFEDQSGESKDMEADTACKSEPVSMEVTRLGPAPDFDETRNQVYFGETIRSFRSMLKRYHLWWRDPLDVSLDQERFVYWATFAMFPFLRGPQDGIEYNLCNTVLLHWVTLCYQGWRGSIRYKAVLPDSEPNSSDRGANTYYVERLNPSSFASFLTGAERLDGNDSTTQFNAIARFDQPWPVTGARGAALTSCRVNNVAEFEIPYQVNYRFEPGKRKSYKDINPRMPTFLTQYQAYIDRDGLIDYWVAAGEDFQPLFWTGMPALIFETTAPDVTPPP